MHQTEQVEAGDLRVPDIGNFLHAGAHIRRVILLEHLLHIGNHWTEQIVDAYVRSKPQVKINGNWKQNQADMAGNNIKTGRD